MTIIDTTDCKPETNSKVEMTFDELEAVSGGNGKSNATATGGMFLTFQFKLVAVKTISWAHDD